MMQFSIGDWLTTLETDGVNLNIRELLSYQYKTALLDLKPRKSIQAKLAGSYLARSKGRGMEFDEARHYQPGDDIRSIDWRVTARTGKTHTKLYREEKERPVFIVTDLTQSMRFGSQFVYKSVQAAHLSSLIAWSAVDRGDRVGALLFNQYGHREFRPRMRAKSVLNILGGLTHFHNGSDQKNPIDLAGACARLRRMVHPGAKIFVISDFVQFNPTALRHLSQIASHCEVTACVIHDPFEQSLPSSALNQAMTVTDGTEHVDIALDDKDFAQRYQQSYQQFSNGLRQQLLTVGVRSLMISAGQPLSLQLGSCR